MQVAALDEPHVHIQSALDFPIAVNGHHVRLVEPRRRPSLATEPLLKVLVLGKMRRKDLHRDDAVGVHVVGPPHLTHAAAAEQLQ